MKRRISHQTAGFTLIELLCVIAIIALLAGLLIPATSTAMLRGKNMQCLSNLRQIGVAANAAANDNNGYYPIVAIDVNTQAILPDSVGNSGNIQNMVQALTPYGVSQKTFQCPLDMPPGPDNYDSQLGLTGCNSSYMWAPYSEGEPTTNITKYTRRGAFTRPPSRIVLASDWQAVHASSMSGSIATGYAMNIYAVYADGHAASTSHGYYIPSGAPSP